MNDLYDKFRKQINTCPYNIYKGLIWNIYVDYRSFIHYYKCEYNYFPKYADCVNIYNWSDDEFIIHDYDIIDIYQKIKCVRELNICSCYITYIGFDQLCNWGSLKILNIDQCDQINIYYECVCTKLTNLEMLTINNNKKITDDGLRYINRLKHLKILHIRNCKKITNKCLKYISRLRELKILIICGN